jgi:membrane protease subunit HflC
MQKLPIIAIIAGVILIGLSLSVFTVDERQTAIVLQFGQPKQVYDTAGLKVKLPFPIQNVRYFDKRILEVDPAPRRVNISSDRNNPILADVIQHYLNCPNITKMAKQTNISRIKLNIWQTKYL